MYRFKTLTETDLKNKTVIYRAPYDIGTKLKNGKYHIKDDSRIRATLPSLEYLLNQSCKIVILTYVKRPDGKVVQDLRTKPHAEKLSKLLRMPVKHLTDCIGEDVQNEISQMQPKEIIMLENTRFYKQEDLDDPAFAQELAKNGEIVVFDAFPQSHRACASVTGILNYLPSCVGFYFEQEVNTLNSFLENHMHPLTLVIGGVKSETKIPIINNFLNVADNILIAGKLVQDPLAKELNSNPKVLLAELTLDSYDITTDSAVKFKEIIAKSKQVIWAGPIGLYEDNLHITGTKEIIAGIIEATSNGAKTLVAGGDTIEALKKYGDTDKVSYVSLAGGATLEFLAGKKLPAIEILKLN